MKKRVLISGASIAGLTLAYWLNEYGYDVTLVEISNGLRRGGTPIDVRGKALEVAKEMSVWKKIKANQCVTSFKMVDAQGDTITDFSINDEEEYKEDIEIRRDDLIDILYDTVANKNIKFYFNDRIAELVQKDETIKVTFKSGRKEYFDFVFGADGIHSTVRKLCFGKESEYSKFYGEYYALVETPDIKPRYPQVGAMYNEPGKMATIYPFNNTTGAFLVFKSPQLNWDYRDVAQHKQILKSNFTSTMWRIPEIIEATLKADNVFFDEVCQIQMDSWSEGRVALVGDAAYAASFHTGMGSSLAMEGAYILAKELNANDDYKMAFQKYYDRYKPFTEKMQSRISRGLKYLAPETESDIQKAINRFREHNTKNKY